MDTHVPDPTSRRTLAVVDTYEDAQEIVDRLADDGFPVEHVTIVGRDLQIVERVTGHLDGWKALLGGAASGLAMGAFFGLLFGLLFSTDGTSLLAIVLYWLGAGAFFGAVFGLVSYLLMRGRRNFASVSGMSARRYEILVDEALADDALTRLASTTARPRSRTRS
jgi:hypothetical protein